MWQTNKAANQEFAMRTGAIAGSESGGAGARLRLIKRRERALVRQDRIQGDEHVWRGVSSHDDSIRIVFKDRAGVERSEANVADAERPDCRTERRRRRRLRLRGLRRTSPATVSRGPR